MNELETVTRIAPQLSLAGVLLWIYIRSDNANREETKRRFDVLEAKVEKLATAVIELLARQG